MEYKEDDYLLISGLQHFMFCRRQWALIHIENQWQDNHLTADGELIHKRVHSVGENDFRNGILTIRGLQIKSSQFGITGTCDAVEFTPSDEGVTLFGYDGKWSPCPVEYKHGKSKTNDCDRMQIVAQVVCLEEMFCCSISEGMIYYHETRRREKVAITDELRETLRKMTDEMHNFYNRGYTPEAKGGSCSNCSFCDVCMPKISKTSLKVSDYIRKHLEED